MIKNGLIEETNIYGVPFKQDLIPITNKTARPAIPIVPIFITVHNTGNRQKSADAAMHTEFVDTNTGYVSWHMTVDDKEIIQELPILENGWHSGDGRGQGNMASIAIEICEYEGINWPKARENAIKLIVYLILNVPTLDKNDPIKPHQHWSGKYCPRKILDEGWGKFYIDIDVFRRRMIEQNTKVEINTVEDACKFLQGKAFNEVDGWIKKAKADPNLGNIFLSIAKGWTSIKNTEFIDVVLKNIIDNRRV